MTFCLKESNLNLEYWEALEYEGSALPTRARKRKPVSPSMLADTEENKQPDGPLASFYTDELILGEATVVKSGKEATVYCCQAHPRLGKQWLAAKWYRPRRQRNFKNDSVYQQGRTTLDARLDRAIATRTEKGIAAQFGMWIGHEFATLQKLHQAGADVPEPIAHAGSAILMEYFGERGYAAPQLHNVQLERNEVGPLFEQILNNLEIFLDCDRVHGDLSDYNILYWNGRLQFIDFPQAVDPMDNPDAFSLFARDLNNIYQYFVPYGVQCDPVRLAHRLWIESGRAAPSRKQEYPG